MDVKTGVPKSVEKSFLYAIQSKDLTIKARLLALLYKLDGGNKNKLLNIKQLLAQSKGGDK